MRFQIMCKRDDQLEFQDLFDADTIDDAREIAVRACMKPGYTVYVYDVKLEQRVLNFDDEKHRL